MAAALSQIVVLLGFLCAVRSQSESVCTGVYQLTCERGNGHIAETTMDYCRSEGCLSSRHISRCVGGDESMAKIRADIAAAQAGPECGIAMGRMYCAAYHPRCDYMEPYGGQLTMLCYGACQRIMKAACPNTTVMDFSLYCNDLADDGLLGDDSMFWVGIPCDDPGAFDADYCEKNGASTISARTFPQLVSALLVTTWIVRKIQDWL